MILYLIIHIVTIYVDFRLVEKIKKRKDNIFNQVFCPPGGGKTTLAADLVRKIMTDSKLKSKEIYSNVPIVGAKRLDLKDIGHYYLHDCVLIIDEAGAELSNRNWQHNLDLDQIKTLKLHRHLNIDIWLFSQTYGDVDNKFRDLTTGLYMLKPSNLVPFRIKAKAIKKEIDLINGQIIEYYEWDRANFFNFWTVPNWAWFNTAQVPVELPDKIWTRYRKSDCD